MKSIRLNNTIRETIFKNIKEQYHKNNQRPEVTIKPMDILKKATKTFYMERSLAVRKVIEANPSIDACITKANYLCCCTPEGHIQHFSYLKTVNEEERYIEFINKFADAVDFHNEDFLKKYPSLIKVRDEYLKAKKEARKERAARSEYDRKLKEFMDEIEQIVLGVNTTKQLLEVWPEVSEYLPTVYQDPSKVNLPAINVASLNSKLGK